MRTDAWIGRPKELQTHRELLQSREDDAAVEQVEDTRLGVSEAPAAEREQKRNIELMVVQASHVCYPYYRTDAGLAWQGMAVAHAFSGVRPS